MKRTKAELQKALVANAEERVRLEAELFQASIEVYIVVYSVSFDEACKVIGLPLQVWVSAEMFGLHFFFDPHDRVVNLAQPHDAECDEDVHFIALKGSPVHVNGGSLKWCSDEFLLRAFTSKDRAEACLALWIQTAGTREFE